MPHAGGRPTSIDKVVGTRPGENGGPDVQITVADRIVELLAAGNYLETAAAAAGVHKDTVYNWLKIGAQAHLRAGAGSIDDLELSDYERKCVEFSDAVVEAEARYESSANLTLERLARGGIKQTVTTTKTLASGDIETTVREQETLPDAQVIEWRLTRRFRNRYAERVELTGADGGPVMLSQEEKASAVLQLVRDLKASKQSKSKRKPDPKEQP